MFNKIVIELLFREIQKVLDMRKWQKVFQTNEGLTSMNYDYQYSHSYSHSPSFSLAFLSISLSPSNSPLLLPSFTRSLFTFLNFCLYSFLSLVDQCLFDICYEVESLKSHRVFFWKPFHNPFHKLVCKEIPTCLGCTVNHLFVFTDMNVCVLICDPLGSSVHGILQARILEWVVIPFSRGSS